MGKHNHHKPQKHTNSAPSNQEDKPVTLKDLLGAGTVAKLKQQAEMMKQEEAERQEAKRKEIEAARQAELKLKEKDFEYLLNNSKGDWRKYN